MKRLKVLVVSVGPLVKRGVESYLLNLYANMDHHKFSVCFWTPYQCENEDFFILTKQHNDQVIEMKINTSKWSFPFILWRVLKKYLEDHSYDVVYINTGNVLSMSIAVSVAYRVGIAGRVVHAHNGGRNDISHNVIKIIVAYAMNRYPNMYLTCSEVASKFVFPKRKVKEAVFIPNGVELKRFEYRPEYRNEYREKYHLNGSFVVGHVGAFIPQKNHSFLIDCFAQAYRANNELRLVLVGEGIGQESIISKVHEMGLEKVIIFAGRCSEIEKWYCAFDMFVLPSLFEGLPVSAVEAQASGLRCLFSDTITKEVELTDGVKYLPLKEEAMWINNILMNVGETRGSGMTTIKLKMFDVKSVATDVTEKLVKSIKK